MFAANTKHLNIMPDGKHDNWLSFADDEGQRLEAEACKAREDLRSSAWMPKLAGGDWSRWCQARVEPIVATFAGSCRPNTIAKFDCRCWCKWPQLWPDAIIGWKSWSQQQLEGSRQSTTRAITLLNSDSRRDGSIQEVLSVGRRGLYAFQTASK